MNFSALNILHRLGPEPETSGSNCERQVTLGFAILIAVIFLFSIAPIAYYQHLPLADYPNHLARLQIQKVLSSNPYLAKFYNFGWILTPYFGFDLLALPLIYFLPVELVGKIIIVVSFLIVYAGTILLDRQLNNANWGLSLFSGIFFYNGAFKFGFTAYVSGVGFAIWAFWIWVRYRDRADSPWMIVVFVLSGALVCIMHLYAFGIYAVCVAGYECSLLWDKLRVERGLRSSLFRIPLSAAASLILPLLVLWWTPILSPGQIYRARPLGAYWGYEATVWASLARKVDGLASPVFYGDPVSEIPLLLIIVGLFIWALANRTVVVNRRMIIVLGAFAIIFVVMPFGLLGSSYSDYRLPSAVAFIALASFGWGKTSPARIKLARLLLAVCLIVRVGSVFSDWQPAQAKIAEYDTALRLIPPGSRLLVIVGRTFWGDRKPPLRHVPVLAAAKQGVFDPGTFTAEGGVPVGLNFKPDYRDYWEDRLNGPPRVSDYKRFDYLMQIRQPSMKVPAEITLEEIKRGQTFVLYRIKQ
jgi:hypothetical protein